MTKGSYLHCLPWVLCIWEVDPVYLVGNLMGNSKKSLFFYVKCNFYTFLTLL